MCKRHTAVEKKVDALLAQKQTSEEKMWHVLIAVKTKFNKKHLKNVGPIRHNEPLIHAHSPDVVSGTVARRLRIDVHDDNDDA